MSKHVLRPRNSQTRIENEHRPVSSPLMSLMCYVFSDLLQRRGQREKMWRAGRPSVWISGSFGTLGPCCLCSRHAQKVKQDELRVDFSQFPLLVCSFLFRSSRNKIKTTFLQDISCIGLELRVLMCCHFFLFFFYKNK